MDFTYLLKGLAVGFSLAAPVGPIGVMCIRRTLAYGSRRGLFVGLGAATADMIYGVVAAFGLTLVSDFISSEQHWIRLIGGLLLLALGYRTLRSHPSEAKTTNGTTRHVRTFISVFILTLTNPMTLFAFAAIFAGIGVERIIGDHGRAHSSSPAFSSDLSAGLHCSLYLSVSLKKKLLPMDSPS